MSLSKFDFEELRLQEFSRMPQTAALIYQNLELNIALPVQNKAVCHFLINGRI
jgi:hypothetical protein